MPLYKGWRNLSLKEKLVAKTFINSKTGCWEWQASRNNIGYGFIRDGKKMRTAHRVSYEEFKGPIPHDMCVCHTCDNYRCVNPDHLWLGTRRDNMLDMYKKGRNGATGCPVGYRYRRVTCEHCNQTISITAHTRFHGDKCKSIIKV